jgi:hypothetical protein
MFEPAEKSPANSSPKDLAIAVYTELVSRSVSQPGLETLIELFESMFFASLQTEESEPVVFHVVYLDPENPDPKPPDYPPHDRWSCVRFSEPLAFGSRDFIKMAGASDPRTSSFALHKDSSGRLIVWGLIDQGNRYHEYVNFDSQIEPERPGIFQASITSIGHVEAYIEYEKVAELKRNLLVRSSIDVLGGGPVARALEQGIRASFQKTPPEELPILPIDWQNTLVSNAISAVRRLLLRVQNIHHGGAFLITPDTTHQDLSVKHKIIYDRLRHALERHAQADAEEFFAGDMITEDYVEKDRKRIPTALYVSETIAKHDLEDLRSELRSIVWFVSLLTRVDGLVLLNPGLDVQGFGVEIRVAEEPAEVFIAGDVEATESKLRQVDYKLYGTRHRSMMRYCAKFPGSVGFVISQDDDVRVMVKTNARLVVWDNIRMQLPEFIRRKKQRKARIARKDK